MSGFFKIDFSSRKSSIKRSGMSSGRSSTKSSGMSSTIRHAASRPCYLALMNDEMDAMKERSDIKHMSDDMNGTIGDHSERPNRPMVDLLRTRVSSPWSGTWESSDGWTWESWALESSVGSGTWVLAWHFLDLSFWF